MNNIDIAISTEMDLKSDLFDLMPDIQIVRLDWCGPDRERVVTKHSFQLKLIEALLTRWPRNKISTRSLGGGASSSWLESGMQGTKRGETLAANKTEESSNRI